MIKTLTGVFEQASINVGSKSERDAIQLRTEEGETFEVRANGESAFDQGYLKPYVGKKVEVTGIEAAPKLLVIKNLNDITPVV